MNLQYFCDIEIILKPITPRFQCYQGHLSMRDTMPHRNILQSFIVGRYVLITDRSDFSVVAAQLTRLYEHLQGYTNI